MDKDDFVCGYCDAEFSVTHDHINEVSFCPFCGTELVHEDETDDPEKEWE